MTTEPLPLGLLKIWCRMNDSWLSFKTHNKDRFLVNPLGYFIELPDGSFSEISPRMTFPLSDLSPCVDLDSLSVRSQFGDEARFVSVPMVVENAKEPVEIKVDTLRSAPLVNLEFPEELNRMERYILSRAVENGVVSKSGFSKMVELRGRHKTIGSALVYGGICPWESLLSHCLNIRPPSPFDARNLRSLLERREWELTGEILLAQGKINRTLLEYAFKIKREGGRQIGQILNSLNACSETEVDRCLRIQSELRKPHDPEQALIGRILVSQGLVSENDLEDALRSQRIARQPLGKILVSMGHCTQRDIDNYASSNGITFQDEIDDVALGRYLLNTDTISKIQLEEAMRIQQRGRQLLGELLVEMRRCSKSEVEDMVQFQREIRDTKRNGEDRIGSILKQVTKTPSERVDEAAKIQEAGRQPFGAILIALGACSEDDVNQALDIQQKWRERQPSAGDRLGEVLIQQGAITEDMLKEMLQEHVPGEVPLGRILVDKKVCSPEQIIEVLIERDKKRQSDFLRFIKAGGVLEPEKAPEQSGHRDDKKKSIVEKFSNLFSRPKKP